MHTDSSESPIFLLTSRKKRYCTLWPWKSFSAFSSCSLVKKVTQPVRQKCFEGFGSDIVHDLYPSAGEKAATMSDLHTDIGMDRINKTFDERVGSGLENKGMTHYVAHRFTGGSSWIAPSSSSFSSFSFCSFSSFSLGAPS